MESIPDLQHREALVNGVRLHYVEAGSGPPVVLLHGFPQFWLAWRHQIPALAAAGYRVIAPDLRGYNLSEKPPGVASYDLQHLTADVLALIRHAGEESAFLAGHDWGGVIAFSLAARHPQAVRKLAVLNAPHPTAYREAAARHPQQLLRSWYVLAFQVPLLPELSLRATRFAAFRRVLESEPTRPGAFTPEEIDAHVMALSRPGAIEAGINYYRAFMARALRKGGAERPAIRVPTLVLWGERDRYLGPYLLDGLERWIPDLRVRRFPQASHWLMHEEPEAVSDKMARFFSS
ncbi:MAG TPA: alpha/beta fold hydrolase [Deinococcales bacterium]|nr:alpha/beta fold hydrolase [Deinococcales bacterium]